MILIDSHWETTRLSIGDSLLDELPSLETIDDSVAYINEWTGWNSNDHPDNSLLSALVDGELPPGGSKDFFRMQTITRKDDSAVAGYLEIYHGDPTQDTLYLVGLYLSVQHQGQGLGQEVVNGLSAWAGRSGYRRMRLHVALKNWPALRFWTQAGFNQVIEIRGDPCYSLDTFAEIFLEKILA